MILKFIKRAALKKVWVSCFFRSGWLIRADSLGLSGTVYRSRSIRGYPCLPTFEGHARTRMPMHDAWGYAPSRRREIATFLRGASVKGRTRVVIRGVACRGYDVSEVSVGSIKANSPNRCLSRTVHGEPRVGMPAILLKYRYLNIQSLSIFLIWHALLIVFFFRNICRF